MAQETIETKAIRAGANDNPAPVKRSSSFLAVVVSFVLFGAGALVFAWPWLSGAVTIPWDAKAHFYPQLAFLARSLHEGQSPFWTPNVFGGHPQIADPQSLIFSPPHLLLALFDGAPSFVAFDAVVFAMLALGGLAMMMLFRDRNWHPAGGLVAGLVFAFGCSNAWRIQHVGQVLSLAWFAIALWLLLRAIDRASIMWGALAGLTAGFMVVGRDQVAWLCTFILVLVAVWRVAEGGMGLRRLRGLIAPLGAGVVVGALTIALPIALTLALASQSNRAAITFEGAAGGSLHPASFFTLISANLFGTDGPFADYWGPPNPQFWGANKLALARNMADVYVGALPFVALLCVGVLRAGLLAREMWVFTLAALAMTLYALGQYTPVFAYAFQIPGSDLFRRPADATFPLGALLAVISGYMVHRLASGDWRASLRRAGLDLAVIALAFGACVLVAFAKDRLAQALPTLAFTAGWLLAGLALLWGLPRLAGRPTLCVLALALVVSADLRFNNGPNESTALPPAQFEALRPGSKDPTLAMLTQHLSLSGQRDRVEMAAIDFHWPNAGLVHGFDHWLGYNPLRLKWFADATGAIDHVAIPDQRRFSPLFARYASPMANLMGVHWIATGPAASELDASLAPGDLTEIGRTDVAHIYENPRALPRVLFATQARRADFEAMIASGQWPQADFRQTVLLEGVEGVTKLRPAGTARLASYHNTDILVEASSPEGGWLVLNDVWHPWWSVEVDGAPAVMLRANVIFRAVEVGPGVHKVRFVFRPFAGLFSHLIGNQGF